jgi:hypothetical protein
MTKLQKRNPPAYPGLTMNTISCEGGVQYESLPQRTRQPIPLSPREDLPVVSGALGSNNPYRTAYPRSAPTFQVFSPVSPMDVTEASKASAPAQTPQILAPQPHRQSMDTRKSVELRRLDGSPYNPDQAKKIKVAKDMHEGALPPAYKRTASDPINPTEVAKTITNPRDCSKCAKAGNGQGQNCSKCGKHKSMVSSAPHTRVASLNTPTVPHANAPISPTVAGPSVAPSLPSQPRSCHKCGKKKKPMTAPGTQQAFQSVPRGPDSAPLPGIHAPRPQRPAVAIHHAPNTNGVNPIIDIVPPSASTYRAGTLQSPFSQYGDDTPLVSHATEQRFSLFRSLSRKLSGKDKRPSNGPLPSQQLRASQVPGPEQGTGTLINMISKAINDSGPDKPNQQYSRLSAQEQPSRPSSPFSFIETPDGTEGYELKEMGADKDKGKVASPTSPQSEPSIYSPVIMGETLDVDVDRRSRMLQHNTGRESTLGGLAVPGQEQDGSRPPLTRFKSLRHGVNRAASVTRATSLRRLESLKTVHTAWYRDDLAIEGHHGESVPVF